MNQKTIKTKSVESLLSQKISQKINDIYQNQLEHQLSNISFKLFDHTLIIILEGIITSPEKLLKDNDRHRLAQQVRNEIEKVINPQIKNAIEEILDIKVVDFLSDTTIDNDLTGAIFIFELTPKNTLNNYKS